MNVASLRRAGIAVIAGAVLALTGCSAGISLGGKTISRSDLESEVAKQVARDPERALDVTCDGDLEGKVGATQKCTVHAGGEELPYTVTVTSVDGSDIKFHIQSDAAQ